MVVHRTPDLWTLTGAREEGASDAVATAGRARLEGGGDVVQAPGGGGTREGECLARALDCKPEPGPLEKLHTPEYVLQ